MKKNEEAEVDKGLKVLARSSMIVFIGLALSKILTYVYRIILARYFGPEVYGLFSLAVMILGWFVAVFSFGLADGLLRYIPLYRGKKEYDKINHLVKISILLLFISGVISSVILFLISDYISIQIFKNPDLIPFLHVFSFLIIIYIFANLFLSILRAFEEIAWYSFILNILQNVVKVVALIFLIFIGFKSNSILFSYFAGLLAVFIVAYIVGRYKLKELFIKNSLKKYEKKKITKSFLSYSWPIMFASIFYILFFWIDSFSIGYFFGAIEVGIYNAAVPLVLLLGFVPEVFGQLFFPLITREFSGKRIELITELSKQVGKWIFVVNLPLFALLIIFPEAIINLLFGQEYLAAASSLRILSVGYFLSSLVYVSGNLITMAGKSKLVLTNIILTSIVNLVLNSILVPRLGLAGAAIATTISWIILSLAWLIEAYLLTSIIPFRRKMLRIFLVSLVPFLILILLKSFIGVTLGSMILLGTFFILLYILLISLTKCFDKNDFLILKSIRQRITGNYSLANEK